MVSPTGYGPNYRETGERLLSGRYINGAADGLWRALDPAARSRSLAASVQARSDGA